MQNDFCLRWTFAKIVSSVEDAVLQSETIEHEA